MFPKWFGDLTQLLTFGFIIYLTLQNRRIMGAQDRLDAANAKTAKALAGIGADIRALVNEARNGAISEESLAKAEENAAALEALDNERGETEEGAGEATAEA